MNSIRPFLILSCLSGFAGAPARALESGSPASLSPPAALSWPAAPERARIRYVSTLPDDLGALVEAPSTRLQRFLRAALGMDPATEARPKELSQPTGVFVRGKKLYVADPGVGRVVCLDLEGGPRAVFPQRGLPKLPQPVGVVALEDGRVVVSDSILRKVMVYDSQGKLLSLLKLSDEAGCRPTGLALDDARGRIYVSDTANHRVEAFALDGKAEFKIGGRGTGKGRFNFPTYLALERLSGDLWVCDSANFRVQAFDEKGNFKRAWGRSGDRPGYLFRPRGLATDSEGHVYNADASMEAVQVFDARGDFLMHFGGSGTGPGGFSLPGGLAFDGQDRLYVADTFNARVQVFEYLK